MRKCLFLIVLWLAAAAVSAQLAAKYQVQRGDTYASIAEKFGMTENELRHKNPGKRHLYAGMNIDIIDYYNGRPRNIQRERYDDRVDMGGYEDSRRVYGTSSYTLMDDPSFQEAQRLEQMGKYKDAAKIYSSMIDRNPSAPLYFVRGVCYYQNKKWKNAISDFEYVMNARDASDALLDECEQYLESAHEQRELKRERNAATWAGILTGVIAVGAVADAISSHDSHDHQRGNRDSQHRNGQQRGGNRDGQQAGNQQRSGNRDGQQASRQPRGGNRQQADGQQRGGNRPQGQRGNGERRNQRNRD